MAYINNLQYYTNNNNAPGDLNWGSYQFVSMSDVVNNFMLMNIGDDKLLNNVKRHEVIFHAKRGIQEITYDALRNFKIIEIQMGDNLKLIMPPDYVNYVRISVNVEGVLYPLHENLSANSATAYLQDNNQNILFDLDGEVLTGESVLDIRRGEQQQYFGPGTFNGYYGWSYNGNWYFGYNIGSRYGLQTDTANVNPTFTVNRAAGVIDFSSGVRNQLIVIEYISDGMENGNDDAITINKLAEDYLYAYIKWAILDNKYGIQEYVIRRAEKAKTAKLRNAKLRLSNIHASRLIMVLRGKDKIIK